MRATSNITGAEAAREILQAAQIGDVEVVEINDYLGAIMIQAATPCLSTNVYNTPSVAALGIAAHEPAMPSRCQSLCAAQGAHGHRPHYQVASQMLRS